MKNSFEYRSYGKGELALLYTPHVTQGAARRKLMYWISLQPCLMQALHEAGFDDRCRSFTPAQVKLIVEALGEP